MSGEDAYETAVCCFSYRWDGGIQGNDNAAGSKETRSTSFMQHNGILHKLKSKRIKKWVSQIPGVQVSQVLLNTVAQLQPLIYTAP